MSDRAIRAEAPGRVNLIGEHTDYNGGFVLPVAIPQRTRVMLTPRSDTRVVARSYEVGLVPRDSYELGNEERRGAWIDYVQGLTHVLRGEGFVVRGFDLDIDSDVPTGSGLSSSAALEISVMRALRKAFALDLADVRMAVLCQRAENEFVGAPVGIMDQMACALADEHTALFLDTRTLEYRRVPLPDTAELFVINSGIAHNHASGDYRTRRAECEAAARLLGVAELRDCSLADLSRVNRVPDPLNRRARHVIAENARVHETVSALERGDLQRVGELFYASHASMRDDFNVSLPEIDRLVSLAGEQDEVFGARLTGGGFGGSIVALARRGDAFRAATAIAEQYRREIGCTPTVLVPHQRQARGTLLRNVDDQRRAPDETSHP